MKGWFRVRMARNGYRGLWLSEGIVKRSYIHIHALEMDDE